MLVWETKKNIFVKSFNLIRDMTNNINSHKNLIDIFSLVEKKI